MTIARVPRGTPSGGQFAPTAHTESDVSLDAPDDGPRFATLDDLAAAGYVTDEWQRWQQGGCGTYALALIAERPDLRLGVLGQTQPDGGWRETHFVAHDDHYAYDSAGHHRLPYRGIEGDCDVIELDQDPDDYGLEDEALPEDVTDAVAHARRHDILGAPPGDGWQRRVSEYTGLVSHSREFAVRDGRATHTVSGLVPGEEPRTDGEAIVLGGGGITVEQNGRYPGEMHYKVLDAPLLDLDGHDTGQRVKAIYVNWVEVQRNRGKGWASAMYHAVREAHPDCIIPAAANLEPPGKRLVKHYRGKYPEAHTGRFDTDNRVVPTTGPDDPTYRAEMLHGPSWEN